MTIYRLSNAPVFPPADHAEPDGMLAVGGDLGVERLLEAYRQGIFPWFSEGQPILWWSPDPRMVLPFEDFHVSKRLARTVQSGRFEFSLDRDFAGVIAKCATTFRPAQDGTWITPDMVEAYLQLHEEGYAHSAEAWLDGKLVGGLYGVSMGTCFFGESMFSQETDASKSAFVVLVEQLMRWNFTLLDCQMHTEHLARFGAREVPRTAFLEQLEAGLEGPTRQGRWSLD